MTGRVEGKVAFITGAARGQGRSHAIRLAEEGAAIIAVDICAQIDTAPAAMSTTEDLAMTVKEVEARGGRIIASQADVRDFDTLKTKLDEGVEEFGRLDIVCANAGIGGHGLAHEISEQSWQDMIDPNLTGVWHTAKAAIPHLIDGGRGGSIILTSSGVTLKPAAHIVHYLAAKAGVVGVMRGLAIELAKHWIRVNSVHPTNVNTPLLINDSTFKLFMPDEENPTQEMFAAAATGMNALAVPYVEPIDITNAVLFLASEESRYMTGVALPVDAGWRING